MGLTGNGKKMNVLPSFEKRSGATESNSDGKGITKSSKKGVLHCLLEKRETAEAQAGGRYQAQAVWLERRKIISKKKGVTVLLPSSKGRGVREKKKDDDGSQKRKKSGPIPDEQESLEPLEKRRGKMSCVLLSEKGGRGGGPASKRALHAHDSGKRKRVSAKGD